MSECPLLAGDPPRTCDWCVTDLPRRKDGEPHRNRRWCSQECSDEWARQHVWELARATAVERDGWTCQRCGRIGWRDVPSGLVHVRVHPADTTRYPAVPKDYAQAWGLGPPGLTAWRDLEPHMPEPILELVRAERDMQTRWTRAHFVTGATHDLEVNHIEPRRGEGYQAGCHHHLDNLETLCRDCHVEVTAAQRRGFEGSACDLPPEPDQLSLGVAS